MIRSILLPALVALWGIAIVARGLLAGPAEGASTAYQSGMSAGLIFGGLMAVAGIFATWRGIHARR
jgi:hypothetical protein